MTAEGRIPNRYAASDQELLQMWVDTAENVGFELDEDDPGHGDVFEGVMALLEATKSRLDVGPQPSLTQVSAELAMAQTATMILHDVIKDIKPLENSEPVVYRLRAACNAIAWPEATLSCNIDGEPCDCLS